MTLTESYYIKHTRKQMNHGLLKEDRIEPFKKLLELMEENKQERGDRYMFRNNRSWLKYW